MNRISKIELTNMCLVYNDTSVLVQKNRLKGKIQRRLSLSRLSH